MESLTRYSSSTTDSLDAFDERVEKLENSFTQLNKQLNALALSLKGSEEEGTLIRVSITDSDGVVHRFPQVVVLETRLKAGKLHQQFFGLSKDERVLPIPDVPGETSFVRMLDGAIGPTLEVMLGHIPGRKLTLKIHPHKARTDELLKSAKAGPKPRATGYSISNDAGREKVLARIKNEAVARNLIEEVVVSGFEKLRELCVKMENGELRSLSPESYDGPGTIEIQFSSEF